MQPQNDTVREKAIEKRCLSKKGTGGITESIANERT